jgi:predicted ArsR family transcriptional regulator
MPFRVERLRRHLERLTDKATADDILGPDENAVPARPAKRAAWVRCVMDRLDERVDAETRNAIMESCGRDCMGWTVIQKAKRLYRAASGLDDFLAKLNEARIGGERLRRDGETIRGTYVQCACGAVRKTEEPFSSTYCRCSCGWYKALFESVLERPVEVELLGSIIQGDPTCEFVIRLNET